MQKKHKGDDDGQSAILAQITTDERDQGAPDEDDDDELRQRALQNAQRAVAAEQSRTRQFDRTERKPDRAAAAAAAPAATSDDVQQQCLSIYIYF